MTPIFARSVLILFATSALGACATPQYPVSQAASATSAGVPAATREPAVGLVRAVDRDDLAPAEFILAAHHRHHAAAKPVHKASARHAAAADDEADPPATYTVKKGDTLEKIADKLGVTIPELKTANHLTRSAIQPGQVLEIPDAAAPKGKGRSSHAAKAEPEGPTTYTVNKGDTLFSISKKLGVSLDDLRDANGLSAKGQIHAGQTLKLPGAEETAEPEAPAPAKGKGSRRKAAPVDETVADEAGQAAGRVVEVEGPPKTYKVKKGDTLEKVADKLDTEVARLKKDNRIKGSMIHPGQVLKGPRSTTKAYVARSGDSLGDVARRFGVSTEHLRQANGLRRGATLRSGQELILPAGYRDHGPIGASSRMPEDRMPPSVRYTPRPEPTTPPVEGQTPRGGTTPGGGSGGPQPYTPPRTFTPIPTTPGGGPPLAPQAVAPPTDAQISELGRGRFQWPLKGEILSDFGPKTPGQRNDGINIQANAGDAVRAAASGDIVYAGDQVPGFGNLVLIKHADGWVTAYGHLSKVEVKMQQKIVQGQEIGQAGSTGGVTEPQLHFEVRFAPNPLDRARPVDPKLVLPH